MCSENLAVFLMASGFMLKSYSLLWALSSISVLLSLASALSTASSIRLLNSKILMMNEKSKDAGEFGLKEFSLPLNLPCIRLPLRSWILASFTTLAVSLLGLYWSAFGQSKHIYHYDKGGIEIRNPAGIRTWEVMFPGAAQTEIVKLCGPDADLPWKAGMVLRTFQFWDTKWCMYIDQDCEIDYLRDAQNNVVDLQGRELFAKEN